MKKELYHQKPNREHIGALKKIYGGRGGVSDFSTTETLGIPKPIRAIHKQIYRRGK